MSRIQRLLDDLQDTDAIVAQIETVLRSQDAADADRINLEAIQKRRVDLERRLNTELQVSQTDLVSYKIDRSLNKYPVLAVAQAIRTFQELVTAIFDAVRTTPKQRYRPSAENLELSSLNFAVAVAGSVVVSMSVENDRLLGLKSELDLTFDEVFLLLNASDNSAIRELVGKVGIASISKAYAWAENSAEYGLNTTITVAKDQNTPTRVEISNSAALALKEAIESASDEETVPEQWECELIGIDGDTSYFHIRKIDDDTEVKGSLSDAFPANGEWTTHRKYLASLNRTTQIKFATGEEKTRWSLANLIPSQTE
nr:hypothetical protein Hi04_10k_c5418_00010 [uncultured bacterium]